MNIQEILHTVSTQKNNKDAIEKLLSIVNINNETMCKLLTKKSGLQWIDATITGQEYTKKYNRYVYRHGVALLNEKHEKFDKIDNTNLPEKSFRTMFNFFIPKNKLTFSATDKIVPDENFILCSYGTALSATEKHTYQEIANSHNWVMEYLILNGYTDTPSPLTINNDNITLTLIKETLNEYMATLVSDNPHIDNEMSK